MVPYMGMRHHTERITASGWAKGITEKIISFSKVTEDGRAKSAMKSSLHHLPFLGAAPMNFLKRIMNFKHTDMDIKRIIKRMSKDGWKVCRSLPTGRIIVSNKMRTIMCNSYNDAYRKIYGIA